MKPMLAATTDGKNIQFPVYVSPKLDGVRALVKDGVLVSRTLKPIRNVHTSNRFYTLGGFDGELIVGEPSDKDVFNRTTSGVMTKDGLPDVTFYVFDRYDMEEPFNKRLASMPRAIANLSVQNVIIVPHLIVNNESELLMWEKSLLKKGYEGVMIRKIDAPYKFGRSSLNQGYLLKLKRFSDSEAEILDVTELLHNDNVSVKDHLGHGKRSSHKANMRLSDTMGSLKLRDIHTKVEFEIGTGFSAEVRQEIWNNKEAYIGKIAKYKFFAIGVKDKPRFPVFLGLRDVIDIGEV